VAWTDDGTDLQAMLFPAKDSKPVEMVDFKFYVVGGVTNLGVVRLDAFDSSGDPVTGVTAVISSFGM
jgi:hypothetical protein